VRKRFFYGIFGCVSFANAFLEKFICGRLENPFFLAGGGENVAKYEPPARAANSPPSRPPTREKKLYRKLYENCGRDGGGERNAGWGRFGGGGLTRKKNLQHLNKKRRGKN